MGMGGGAITPVGESGSIEAAAREGIFLEAKPAKATLRAASRDALATMARRRYHVPMLAKGRSSRLRFIRAARSVVAASFADAVREGLSGTPKTLPSMYFYDARGSELFERICELTEYYLTRCEHEILERSACEIAEAAGPPREIVELGPGNAMKSRLLIRAALAQSPAVRYVPIDICADVLETTAEELLAEHERLEVQAVAGEFAEGLAALPEPAGARLFLFMGSNIGNFEDPQAVEFIGSIRAQMRDGDRMLVGADLVKDEKVLWDAYNDSRGVTAEFNKNILLRVNSELGGDFKPGAFEHFAPFVTAKSRIEMHLVSASEQSVGVRDLGESFSFEPGESIWTGISRKYRTEELDSICTAAGLTRVEAWFDAKQWFTVALYAPVAEASP
jgi:L-histidine N-alpha-methyltransferase